MENRTLEDDIASQQQRELEHSGSHAVVGALLNDVIENIVQNSAKEEFNASGVLKGSTESLNNRKVANLETLIISSLLVRLRIVA
jgi:hypothetical protein